MAHCYTQKPLSSEREIFLCCMSWISGDSQHVVGSPDRHDQSARVLSVVVLPDVHQVPTGFGNMTRVFRN